MIAKHSWRMTLVAAALGGNAAWAAEYDQQYDDRTYDQSGYSVPTLDERVGRLEKRLSGSSLADMVNSMEKMKAEMMRLRGEVEDLRHKLDAARKQQKDQYADLDQRVQKITPAPPPVAPVPGPDGTVPGGVPPVSGVAPDGTPLPAGADAQTAQPVAPPPPPPPPVNDTAARQAAYQKAFDVLKDGKYAEAVKGFKSFLTSYPTGEYADNAYYWMGEAQYVNRDFSAARDAFKTVQKEFPSSGKIPDSALKLAFIEYENGQYGKAKDMLDDVVKKYPGTSAAKMAEKRLEKMRQEKR